MCKVMRLQFVCGHRSDIRKSRCRGTCHRRRRADSKAACTAEPYILLALSGPCSGCNQEEWENDWKQRLYRARMFLDKLTERSWPSAVGQISKLLIELQQTYDYDVWNMGRAAVNGRRVERPKPGSREIPKSPLKQEVRPQDVVLKEEKDQERAGNEEDDDCIPCIDPFYSNHADYNAMWDDYDEDASATSSEGGFVPEEHTWKWNSEATDPSSDANNQTLNAPKPVDWVTLDDLAARGLEADVLSSSRVMNMDGVQAADEELSADNIKQIVEAFWVFVGEDPSKKPSAFRAMKTRAASNNNDSPANEMTENQEANQATDRITSNPSGPILEIQIATIFRELTISSPNTQSIGQHTLLWTDGAADIVPPKVSSTTFYQPATLSILPTPTLTSSNPSRNSTCARYDEMRHQIKGLRQTNRTRYHALWLNISRWEIQALERLYGRYIPNPSDI